MLLFNVLIYLTGDGSAEDIAKAEANQDRLLLAGGLSGDRRTIRAQSNMLAKFDVTPRSTATNTISVWCQATAPHYLHGFVSPANAAYWWVDRGKPGRRGNTPICKGHCRINPPHYLTFLHSDKTEANLPQLATYAIMRE
jgi:hypothetical protein